MKRALLKKVTTTISASAEAYVEAAARQRRREQLQQSVSTHKLRDASSSQRWKEHYALICSKWGSIQAATATGSLARLIRY